MKNLGTGAYALIAGMLAVALAGCGGGGGSSDGGSGGGSGGSTGGYVLFATDLNSGTIAAFTTADPSAGQSLAAHIVKTNEGGTGIAYDAVHDDLYAMRVAIDLPAVTIDVFAHASKMASNATPARTIQVTGLADLDNSIALDTTRDELWIGGLGSSNSNTPGRLVVLSHASTLSGSVAPTRDIQGLPSFMTFAHDRVHDTLYLAGGGGITHGVYVFANASTLVSDTAPTRTISGVDGTGTYLMSVDEQRDILYVPDVFNGLGIVRNASTGTQAVTTVQFPSATPSLTAVVDGPHDRLYVGAYTNAYVFDNASTLTSASTLPGVTVHADGASIFSFAF